ncbi:MAG TPA: calcium-binding protein, partial [Allocoleopsis sp.]
MTIEGTSGNDILQGIDQGQFEPETISGKEGNDQIFAGAGLDFVYGGAGDDQIFGEADGDVLFGDVGNDLIDGGSGNDELSGDKGRDILIGGSGDDELFGGLGSDYFLFKDVLGDGIDRINDFEIARDYIVVDLNSASYRNAGLTPNASITADQFRQGTAALTASDRFIYDQATGSLFFDPDGTGSTAQTQIATLNNKPTLSHYHLYATQDRLPTPQIPSNSTANPASLHGEWTVTSGNIQYYDPYTGAYKGTSGIVLSYTFNPDGTYAFSSFYLDAIAGNLWVQMVGRYTAGSNGVITTNPVAKTTKGLLNGTFYDKVETTGLTSDQMFWVEGEGARGKYILLDDVVLANGIFEPKDPDSSPSTYE